MILSRTLIVILGLASGLSLAHAQTVEVRPGSIAAEPHHDRSSDEGHRDPGSPGVTVIQNDHGDRHGSAAPHDSPVVHVDPGHNAGTGIVVDRDRH